MKWNKRGRPRKCNPEIDYGTPELQRKRALNATKEVIDIYLEKGIITADQHWCCVHFRWLHALRYGTGAISSSYSLNQYNTVIREDSPEWRQEREQEYLEALSHLERVKLHNVVLNFSVYNKIPNAPLVIDKNTVILCDEDIHSGLSLLEALWCKRKISIF